ncbi:TMF-regulated nuclear protein 1 [Ornithorhynchus anatinus]|uniref:TMF-regulated nuclear protein 1 n=1 Tax=Ornithorhynchus anatinus TaxID=9258 RepID=UPI0010A7DDE1|nr:TMF-regulated nuclear protein 1 [Ornithorhynchus anatinus]
MPGCRLSSCGPAPRAGDPPAPRGPTPPGSPPPPAPQPQGPDPGAAEAAAARPGPGISPSTSTSTAGPGPRPAAGVLEGPGVGGRALELAEARRRLLEVEGRRRVVSELEGRVLHLHRVFLAAELGLAHRAEGLGRLRGGVGQADLHLAAHGQRLKKGLRRRKPARSPALLASALGLGSCVPWAAAKLRRGGRAEPGTSPDPQTPFQRGLQGSPRAPGAQQR